MEKKIDICIRPDWVTYEDIHNLLAVAHEENRRQGFVVKTSEMDAEALEKHIGPEGRCFVALDGDQLVGVTAVRIVSRSRRFVKGRVADQILSAVRPGYTGMRISSSLHEQVIAFAREHGLNQIEFRTAENNHKMQKVGLKWGFHYVDFVLYPNQDHYTAVLSKWLDGCPYSAGLLKGYYELKKAYTKFRWKIN